MREVGLSALLVLVAGSVLTGLLVPRVRNARAWRATVTPLASIIGSGFLVVVPLLGHELGAWAPVGMLAVVVVAWLIGGALRWNITHVEPLLTGAREPPRLIRLLERSADPALGAAYVVSVTFYLRLMAAFALRAVGSDSAVAANILTTAVLAAVGVGGWLGGLGLLERLEEYSVSVKLAVIASLIVGWAIHDLGALGSLELGSLDPATTDPWRLARLMAGVLIVVQGFETSRYLGDEYPGEMRVRTMRWAQVIAAAIYVTFVTLTIPSFPDLGPEISETALVPLARTVAPVLPVMVIVAAVMSQLSAAVADTVGAGGLVAETAGGRWGVEARHGYALVAAVGVALVWSVDIFGIIALASRAFAFYYAIQCALAAVSAHRCDHGIRGRLRTVRFGALAAVSGFVVVFAIPAG